MMNELFIEETAKTPQIDLSHLTGDLIFSGRSIPENAAKVYEPVMNWVTEYITKPKPTTNVRFNLEYFNTASSLWIRKILKVIIRISEPDFVLILHLYLSIDDFDEMNDYEDIKDAFIPISDIDQVAISSIGIKVYGTDEDGVIIKEKLIFFEKEQFASLK
jgi:hypothetical protein